MERIWTVNNLGYSYELDKIEKTSHSNTIICYLDLLCASDKAVKEESGYLVPHESVAEMSEEERKNLELPSLFPFSLSVSDGQGNLGRNNFRYEYKLLKPNGDAFVNPVIIGSYVKLYEGEEYTLDNYKYQMIQLAETSNRKISNIQSNKEALVSNLLSVSQMQNLAQNTEAVLSNVLRDDKIVIPDKLSVQFNKHEVDGSYYPSPLLLKKGCLDNEFEPMDSTAFCNAFVKRRNVEGVYLGRDGKKYVLKDAVRKGLEKVKSIEPLKEDEYERFIAQPKELFEDDIFDFPEGVYSDRVQGFTTVKYRGYTIEGLNEGGWLPEEGTLGSGKFNVTKDNLSEVSRKITDAELSGQTSIVINGQEIPINDALKNQVEAVKKLADADASENVSDTESSNVEKKAPLTLDIMKNDDRLDYVSKNMMRSSDMEFLVALKKGIHLYDHQIDGVKWMYNQWCTGYKGVLLADDMGLGKTLQTLAFVSGLLKTFPDYVANPILIVAPVALLQNWKNEISQFVEDTVYDEIIELHSSNLRNYKVGGKLNLKSFAENHQRCIVQTTYETLRTYQTEFGSVKWSVIITDEAQKIKNPSASQTNAIKGMNYDFAIALSGTPVENTWIDLWSIMDFVQPGKLGSFQWFKDAFQNKLKLLKGTDNDAILNLGKNLKENLSPLFMRRLKRDHIKGLPDKNVEICRSIMPAMQTKAYISAIESFKENGGTGFEIIARLRDISLYPGIGDLQLNSLDEMDINKILNSSARLKKTFEILFRVREKNEKALVFVISKKMQLMLQVLIYKVFGLKVLTPINGDMNGQKRQFIIDEFAARSGFDVLILSPEAAGVGLNITCANHVIHLSRTWNPAKEDQATDRAYRIGQKKPVTVYIPMAICPQIPDGKSFDEKFNNLLAFKRTLSENVLFPTSENKNDFETMIKDITETDSSRENLLYYSLEDLKGVTGRAFEVIISDLYREMGYETIKTKDSGDGGVDVIAWNDASHKKGLLIQCKQTAGDENINSDGVKEVYLGKTKYSRIYPNCEWSLAVITNGVGFTQDAKRNATDNAISLICARELGDLLQKYRVLKR